MYQYYKNWKKIALNRYLNIKYTINKIYTYFQIHMVLYFNFGDHWLHGPEYLPWLSYQVIRADFIGINKQKIIIVGCHIDATIVIIVHYQLPVLCNICISCQVRYFWSKHTTYVYIIHYSQSCAWVIWKCWWKWKELHAILFTPQ